jgi:ABC-type nitrate/sulfonate/bicarbonate transport system substrate-binding protein
MVWMSPPVAGAPRKLKLSWNAGAVCLAPIPIAIEYGFFQKHNLDVELVNYSGSTDQLLEAIATGKSDAGLGMALRWLKPLEQGFDVKIAAGTHGGCMRVLTRTSSAVDKLADLKGKIVAIRQSRRARQEFLLDPACLASTPTRKSIGALILEIFSTSRSRKARFRRSWLRIRSLTSG